MHAVHCTNSHACSHRRQVRFQAAAERARCLLESPDAAPLLAEHSIYVHLPDKARKLMGANAAALRRVAAVLGAKVSATEHSSCIGNLPCMVRTKASCPYSEGQDFRMSARQACQQIAAAQPQSAHPYTALQAAQPRSCTLCIVVGGGSRPPTIPDVAACVKEEWLLLAAERFEAPSLEEFSID